MSLIVILATMGLVQYRQSIVRSKEAVLKEDLFRMRDALDQYFADKNQYPATLDALVTDGYLRRAAEGSLYRLRIVVADGPGRTGSRQPDDRAGRPRHQERLGSAGARRLQLLRLVALVATRIGVATVRPTCSRTRCLRASSVTATSTFELVASGAPYHLERRSRTDAGCSIATAERRSTASSLRCHGTPELSTGPPLSVAVAAVDRALRDSIDCRPAERARGCRRSVTRVGCCRSRSRARSRSAREPADGESRR